MPIKQYPPVWVFRAKVAAFVRPPSATVAEDAEISDIVKALSKGVSHVAVCRSDGSLVTTVDSYAVMGWLARGLEMGERLPLLPVTPTATIAADQSIFFALSSMISQNRPSLLVVDGHGRFLGEIAREQILARVAGVIWDVAAAGAAAPSESGSGNQDFAAMRRCQTEIVSDMLADDIPAEAILAMITEINNEVHRRVLSDVVEGLESDGWGKPPMPFSLLVLGSGGRQENLLDPDQDNAIVIAEPDDVDRLPTETYFIELAERLCSALAANGFAYCKGNMMATSPVWRKTSGEWRAQVRSWVRKKESVLLMNCDTLLDMAHVAGTEQLAVELHRYLLDMVRCEPGFLRALYSIEENHSVGLDWLGRLAGEKNDFGFIAEVNLKLKGMLPLIEGVRLLAVGAGLSETSTTERLGKLAALGVLGRETTEGLIDAFRTITVRLLQHQINMRSTPATSSIRVAHYSLTRSERSALRVALRRVDRFRSQLPAALEDVALRSNRSPLKLGKPVAAK